MHVNRSFMFNRGFKPNKSEIWLLFNNNVSTTLSELNFKYIIYCPNLPFVLLYPFCFSFFKIFILLSEFSGFSGTWSVTSLGSYR